MITPAPTTQVAQVVVVVVVVVVARLVMVMALALVVLVLLVVWNLSPLMAITIDQLQLPPLADCRPTRWP